jgi:hypothetical protein
MKSQRWLWPLALTLLLLSAQPMAAAEPTLGGSLSPAQLVYERDQEVSLTNRSTIPVNVMFTVEGEGWSLGDQPTRTLQVDERVTVPLLTAGEDRATIRAHITPATLPPGMDASTLVLEATARHLTPWEQLPMAAWLLAALVIGLLLLMVVRRLVLRRS